MKETMKKFGAWLMAAALAFAGTGAVQAADYAAANQAEFEDVAANAVSGDRILLGEGKFAIGPVNINGKTLTFVGVSEAKTTVCIGNGGYDGNGGHGSSKTANMTFENLTLDDLVSDAGYLTGFTEAAGLTFRKVTFNVGFSNWGNKGGAVSFYDCTFNQTNTEKYNVQELRSASGTQYLFEGCVFNSAGGRFINAYKQGGATSNIGIVIKNCAFKNTGDAAGKCALNLKDSSDGCTIGLTFVGENKVEGEFPSLNESTKPSKIFATEGAGNATVMLKATDEDDPIVIYANNEKIEGAWIDPVEYKPAPAETVIEIAKPADLVALSAAVNGGDTYAGKKVVLTADLDMTGIEFTPIGNVAAYPSDSFAGTFDGQNHTISNLKASDFTAEYATAGLFGSLCNGAVVQNLKLVNPEIRSSHYAGAIVGYISEGPVKVINCSVEGGSVKSTPELLGSGYDNGDKVGGILGYSVAGSEVTGCSVQGLTITAYRDIGGIAGYSDGTVSGNSVKNTTIVQDNTNGYKDYSITTVGAICGGGTVPAPTANVSEKVEFVKVNPAAPVVDVPTEVITDTEVAEKIQQSTKVEGVQLSVKADDEKPSGVQAVIATAKTQDQEFAAAVEAAAEVSVKVEVEVKPTEYDNTADKGKVAFKLTPKATVTVKQNETELKQVVPVTNDMIDQNQKIAVSIYTGFKPVAITHDDDTGARIELFDGDQIAYNEATGVATVHISHFSTLTSYGDAGDVPPAKAPAVAKIGETLFPTLAAAVAAVKEGETIELLAGTIEESEITLPDTIKNVTIKGAADHASILKNTTLAHRTNGKSFDGLTIDGVVFDNGRFLVVEWGNGSIKNLAFTNNIFRNLDDTTNEAAVHLNVNAAAAVSGFTFENNVIDGCTGGSKSGIYGAVKGDTTIRNNTFNNIAFRPICVQIIDTDGVDDNTVVTGNTFSGSSVGRLQIYGTENETTCAPEGTDGGSFIVNNNIFKDITSQQICCWGINTEKVTTDITSNYYDAEDPKMFWNDFNDANSFYISDTDIAANLPHANHDNFNYYTGLTEDGEIDPDTLVEVKKAVAVAKVIDAAGNEKEYETLQAAVAAVEDGQTIKLLADMTEVCKLGMASKTTNPTITFDLNGHTIYNKVQYGSGLSGTKATFIIKNGTIDVRDENLDTCAIHASGSGQTYKSLFILEDLTIYGYCRGKYAKTGQIDVAYGDVRILSGNYIIDENAENGISGSATAYGGTVQIMGGTFSPTYNVEDYLAPGCYIEEDADGNQIVRVDNSVAEIEGGAKFDSLEEAMLAAQDGDTVNLLKDLNEKLDVAFETNTGAITLNLNGHVIARGVKLYASENPLDLTLNIKGGTIGSADGTSSALYAAKIMGVRLEEISAYGAIAGQASCPVVIVSGNYHANAAGSPVDSYVNSYLTFYGGTYDYDPMQDAAWVSNALAPFHECNQVEGKWIVSESQYAPLAPDGDGVYHIATVENLLSFREMVNSGVENFAGKVVKLDADLNLSAILDWTRIGSKTNPFKGTFDGQNHKISNLTIVNNNDPNGFFGYVTASKPEMIKNLTFENVSITAVGNVGALAGHIYTGYTVSNVNVTGTIQITGSWYLGGIQGGMTYSKYVDCHVDGINKANSFIRSINGPNESAHVGGMLGHCGEDAVVVDGCTVENITFYVDGAGVGGIIGLLQYGTDVRNCAVENIDIVSGSKENLNAVGYIAGRNGTDSGSKVSTVINSTAADVSAELDEEDYNPPVVGRDGDTNRTLIGTGVEYDENGKVVSGEFELIGVATMNDIAVSDKAVISDPDPVTGKITVERAVAEIVETGKGYPTLASALLAAESGDTIEILEGTWGADAVGTLTTQEAGQVRYKSLTIQSAEGATVTFTSDVSLGYDDSSTANATMTVKNLNFEGASLSLSNYVQVDVEGCTFTGAGNASGALVILDSCCTNHKTTEEYPASQVTVKDCTITGTGTGKPGIRLRNAGSVTLTGNEIVNSAHNGILFESNSSIDDTPVKTIVVTNNTITEWNAGNVKDGGRAIRASMGGLADGSTVTIENNVFRKEKLGLDSPDVIKMTEAGNATVSLENNDWNDELKSAVSGNADYYTVNGATPAISAVITTKQEPVCQIIETGKEYPTLQAAVDDAADGQTIKIIADIAGENITVGANVTLVGSKTGDVYDYTLSNVIVTCGTGKSLTVENLKFVGNSYIYASSVEKVAVRGCYADVTPDRITGRAAFLVLGGNGCENYTTKSVELVNNTIMLSKGSNPKGEDYGGTIFGWNFIGDAIISNNVLGSVEKPFTFIGMKFLNAVNGAVWQFSDNTVYGTTKLFNFRAFDLYQNISRANTYTAVFERNDVIVDHSEGSSPYYFGEVEANTGDFGRGHSTMLVCGSDNTMNGETVTLDNLKIQSDACVYVGVCVAKDENGKLIGGVYSADPTVDVADGYEAVAQGTTPETWVVQEKTEEEIDVPTDDSGAAVIPVKVPAEIFEQKEGQEIKGSDGQPLPAPTTKAEKQQFLATEQPNGLKVWQNVAMGVDGNEATNALATTSREPTVEEKAEAAKTGKTVDIVINTPISEFDPPTTTGVTVSYKLLRSTDGGVTWTEVATNLEKPEFPTYTKDDALISEGDTFWKFQAVFTSQANEQAE